MDSLTKALSSAFDRLLRPLVRIMLRNGIPYGSFADIAKRVYVDVAFQEFSIEGRKPSASRVSVITGLSRKEVKRVRSLPEPDDLGAVERYNRAARVISGWIRDTTFLDEEGKPADLAIEGVENSFSDLVKKYSGDIPHRAILDELIRVGAVVRTEGNGVRLLARGYVPSTGNADKIGILGVDVSDLISTIDHNLGRAGDDAFFQRKVSYDNLPEENLAGIRMMAREHGQKLLEYLDSRMSEKDRDVNPEVQGTGRRRAGVGVFYFEEGVEEDSER